MDEHTSTWSERRATNPWWWRFSPVCWLKNPDYMGEGLIAMYVLGIGVPVALFAVAAWQGRSR